MRLFIHCVYRNKLHNPAANFGANLLKKKPKQGIDDSGRVMMRRNKTLIDANNRWNTDEPNFQSQISRD